jgi:hypothetical protein
MIVNLVERKFVLSQCQYSITLSLNSNYSVLIRTFKEEELLDTFSLNGGLNETKSLFSFTSNIKNELEVTQEIKNQLIQEFLDFDFEKTEKFFLFFANSNYNLFLTHIHLNSVYIKRKELYKDVIKYFQFWKETT